MRAHIEARDEAVARRDRTLDRRPRQMLLRSLQQIGRAAERRHHALEPLGRRAAVRAACHSAVPAAASIACASLPSSSISAPSAR